MHSLLLKVSDNSLDILDHLVQRFHDVPTRQNIRFAKSYIDKNTRLSIRYMVSLDEQEYIASFKKCRHGESMLGRLPSESHLVLPDSQGGDNEEMVLVNDVKRMEPPQEIIPSFVWTEPINIALGRYRHSMCFSWRFGVISFESLCDRKIDPLDGFASVSNKLTSNVIESCSQIVDGISRDQRNFGRNNGNVFDNVAGKVRFCIEIGDREVSIKPNGLYPFDIKISDVLLCPLDL